MVFERYFSEDDGEESSAFSLNESEWHSYLAAIDAEAGKFFKIFIENKHISNHLDMIFAAMKWRRILLSNADFEDGDAVEVITFHKNPINIASKAIFFFVEKIWDMLVSDSKTLTTATCWHFSKLICLMQKEMLNGIANVDSCEYVLAVCHFKNVISSVNEAMISLEKLPKIDGKLSGFVQDFTTALFDIRELAWQSISLCNVAEKRYDGGQF